MTPCTLPSVRQKDAWDANDYMWLYAIGIVAGALFKLAALG
jgi:hypothetical protein